MTEFSTIGQMFGLVEGVIPDKKKKWALVEIDHETVLSNKEARHLRKLLNKAGIETKPTPFGFGENLIEVRHEDFPKAAEIITRWRKLPYQQRKKIMLRETV